MFALADCNNFFVSCERVFRPELNGKPVIVLSNNDGCTVARSNEAKALGIKMGDPYFKIRNLIERYGVTVFSGNMALYGDMSQRVKSVLREASPSTESYSIDESFLDLNGMDIDFDRFAKELSERCFRWTGIPVSVGVSSTKTLAKIASKLCKSYKGLKGGCFMDRSDDIEKVLRKFPVEDVWGIGRRTSAKLHSMFIKTAWDFSRLTEAQVDAMFGLPGVRTWKELRGIPSIEFEDIVQSKQTITNSRSFSKEIFTPQELSEQVAVFATMTAEKLRQQHSVCGQIAVYAMTNRFKENEMQAYSSDVVSFMTPTSSTGAIVSASVKAVKDFFVPGCAYKKAGVTALKISPEHDVTGSLFEDNLLAEKDRRLMSAIDSINAAYGRGTLRLSVCSDSIKSTREHQSPHYSTRLSDFPKVK